MNLIRLELQDKLSVASLALTALLHTGLEKTMRLNAATASRTTRIQLQRSGLPKIGGLQRL
jgi:hypothetical protein